MKIALTVFWCLICGMCVAQDCPPMASGRDKSENTRYFRPLGIEAYIGGPVGVSSLTVSYFLKPNINLQAGVGVFGLHFGARYHLLKLKDKSWAPYAGLEFGCNTTIEATVNNFEAGFFLPVGIQHLSRNGFSFSAEVLPNTINNIWFGVRLGYFFRNYNRG